MKELKKFAGTIRLVSSSPHGEPDGVVLDNGSFVKLPPHSLLEPKQIEVGAKVTGDGELICQSPNSVYHRVILKRDGVVLARDRGDQTGHTAKSHNSSLSKAIGKLAAISTKPKGEVDRMIFEDGTSVHLSKDFELFADDMMIGRTYEVTGAIKNFERLRFIKAEEVQVLL